MPGPNLLSGRCTVAVTAGATVVAKLGTLIAALLLASAAAGCGGASSPRAELSSFVLGYVDQDRDNCCETGMHATVRQVTFARSDPRWAVVSLSVTDSQGRPDGRDFVVAHRASSWQVIGFGKGNLGCRVPARIRADLAAGVPEGVLSC
jgi:hypothetical protein